MLICRKAISFFTEKEVVLMNKERFFNDLKNKKVAVIGIGVSHTDMVAFFLSKGIGVTVLDKRDENALGEDYVFLKSKGAEFLLGDSYLDSLCDFDVIFRTPGMYFLSEQLIKAREQGVAVTSEMEMFFELCPCKTFALTGSDGKTTTTTLIGEMFKAEGKRVHVGGNIGRALLPIIDEITPDDIAVVELSSFQLISMRRSPDVAVITNIAPNHLDVHKDMNEYIEAKINLISHQNAFSRTVLNMDNQTTFELTRFVRGELAYFSRKQIPTTGSYLNSDGHLCRIKNGKEEKLLHYSQILIPGMHNVENYLAAIAAVGQDVSRDAIVKIAENFGGVEHRIEYVRTLDGVKYYNNSIASSPTRTIAELYSFNQKIVVIAGGYDKKIPYEPLAPALCKKAKLLILLGATADKIEAAVKECDQFAESGLEIIRVSTMEEAVKTAREMTTSGDIVSLSPASASFDMYKNFEERGQHYKKLVNCLV